MFHTKICGIQQVADVTATADSGADAIGLNFYPQSVRFVDPAVEQTARLARAAADAGLMRVGVFVNETSDSIGRICDQVGIDLIQLHGDETIEFAGKVIDRIGLPVVRAIKLPTGEMNEELIERAVAGWSQIGCQLLLDADAGAAHGASGQPLDWPAIGRWSLGEPGISWTLSGGLNPRNVRQAVRESGASSVDVASGVESPRGRKSPELIGQFVAQRQNENI